VALHLHFNHVTLLLFVLSRVALQMFGSCLIVQFQLILLLLLAFVHKAMRRVECRSAQQNQVSHCADDAVGDAFWSNRFRNDTVSCTKLIRLFPVQSPVTSAACQATKRIFGLNDCDTVAFGAYVCVLATTS